MLSARRLVLAAGLVLSPATAALAQPDPPSPVVEVRNLGVATGYSFRSDGPYTILSVWEGDFGIDLNGDGDAADYVFHVHDVETGALTNLGLTGSVRDIRGGRAIIILWENYQADANGDGDRGDDVPYVVDLATARTIPTGLAVPYHAMRLGDKLFFLVEERDQGGTDLNGDGDALDHVMHVLDTETEQVINLGLASHPYYYDYFPVSDRLVAFSVPEADQGGMDLDGDGLSTHFVIHLIDTETLEVTNLGVHGSVHKVHARRVAFAKSEFVQGMDLNGDGDTGDWVLHLHDRELGITTNLGVPIYVVDGRHVDSHLLPFKVEERAHGNTDLNGDGDHQDVVLHVLDMTTGQVVNLAEAVDRENNPFAFGSRVAFGALETSDYNGDGDQYDTIGHIFDAGTGALTNLGLALSDPNEAPTIGSGDQVLVGAYEYSQGGIDVNGDGDLSDSFVVVHDLLTGETTHTGLAAPYYYGLDFFDQRSGVRWVDSLQTVNDMVAFVCDERRQGESLNGDEDTTDGVIFVFDPTTRIATNLGLTTYVHDFLVPTILGMGQDRAYFTIPEWQDGKDLNGDGDTDDYVGHVAILRPAARGSVNQGAGEAEEVLSINGEPARLTLAVGEPLSLRMEAAPLGPVGGRYLLWAWNRFPENASVLRVRGDTLGTVVNPTPFRSGLSPQPIRCVTGPGIPAVACGALAPRIGPPGVPWTLALPAGVPFPIDLTIQGIVEDAGAANPTGFSVTNAVLLRVE